MESTKELVNWCNHHKSYNAPKQRPFTSSKKNEEAFSTLCIYLIMLFVIGWFYFAFYPCVMPTVSNSLRTCFASDFLRMFSWLSAFANWLSLKKFLYIIMPFSMFGLIASFVSNEKQRIINGVAGFIFPIILSAGIPVLLLLISFALISLIATGGILLYVGGAFLIAFCTATVDGGTIFATLFGLLMVGLIVAYFAIPIVCWCC